uniref:Tektin n=1 Tax=Sinocyclocheilus anshuiensis TaxID=1608454 RepID=A0A671PNC7_9TELE
MHTLPTRINPSDVCVCLCSLLGEASELNSTVSALQQQLYEARKSFSDLEESKLSLEKDISCKTNSLLIDREKCMTLPFCHSVVWILTVS